jgi:hypothetical protein
MALLPEVHVNFGQVAFERIYQIFMPLIPGSTLVGGLMLVYPASAAAASSALGLGRYSRFALLLCIIYIVGFVLYGLSVFVTANCSVILTDIVFKKWPPKRPNQVSSKSTVWRRVASEFLGASLTPPLPLPQAPALVAHDIEWQDLYNVLQDYVLRGVPVLHNELLLFVTYLQATAWALLYLYLRTPMRGHRSVLVISIILIFSAVILPFGANFFYWKYDRLTPWDFTARLINEIRVRQTQVPPSGQHT